MTVNKIPGQQDMDRQETAGDCQASFVVHPDGRIEDVRPEATADPSAARNAAPQKITSAGRGTSAPPDNTFFNGLLITAISAGVVFALLGLLRYLDGAPVGNADPPFSYVEPTWRKILHDDAQSNKLSRQLGSHREQRNQDRLEAATPKEIDERGQAIRPEVWSQLSEDMKKSLRKLEADERRRENLELDLKKFPKSAFEEYIEYSERQETLRRKSIDQMKTEHEKREGLSRNRSHPGQQ